MKIEGTDQIIKFLLDQNSGLGDYWSINQNDDNGTLVKEIEKVISRNDEVILSRNREVKPEVQFTRSPNESPEVYLLRISDEVVKLRDIERNAGHLEYIDNNLSDIMLEQAMRGGLMQANGKVRNVEHISSEEKGNKVLRIFIVLFFISILSYLLLIK